MSIFDRDTVVTSAYNTSIRCFDPDMPERGEGLHLSTIYSAMAQDYFPKWFKKFPEGTEARARQEAHFLKGEVLEKSWGDAMAYMIPGFERPEPRQHDGVWCSPDGYVGDSTDVSTDAAECAQTPPPHWPNDYPGYTTPAIHECKVSLKSCNEETSPIDHEKFITWYWQVKGYCRPWECTTAYIHCLHLCGDYKERPWTPMVAVHRLDFTAEGVQAHWDRLMLEAEKRGLR